MDEFDCIVIGAGPAGATVARQTARRGLKTLLIEKKPLPRYKPCGGGLTTAVKRLLDFDFNETVEKVVTGVTFLTRKSDPHTAYPEGMKVETVSREKFDYRLVREAVQSGARLMDATGVISVDETEKNAVVYTENGTAFRGNIVVGADGARSVAAKATGLQRPYCGFGIEGEFYPDDENALEEYGCRILFAFGFITGGYGWVFPKSDHFSVGIATTENRMPGMNSIYAQFSSSMDCLKKTKEKSRIGWFLPINRGPRTLNTSRICLAGDAASLIDPFSGEGIYYAIRSGLIAGGIICSELSEKGRLSLRYTQEINREIVNDFAYARRFAAIFYKAPSFFYQRERVLRTYARLANREIKYRDVFAELMASRKRG